MIDKQTIQTAVESALASHPGLFIVDIELTPAKTINVEVDADDNLDIDTIADITRRVSETLGEELDDYDLELGSAGLTAPFKVRRQWEKNIGNEIDLLTTDGRKFTATLDAVSDAGATISRQVKEKLPGEKRPSMVTHTETIPFDAIRRAAYHLSFK